MVHFVRNIIKSKSEVLTYLLEKDINNSNYILNVSFNKIIPYRGEVLPWISSNVERIAKESISGVDVSREVKLLGEVDYEHYCKMLRTYEKLGYFTEPEFRLDNWGTKSNASDDFFNKDKNKLFFNTVNRPALKVYKKLSKIFPDEFISLWYADEDIGENCGFLMLLDGEVVYEKTPSLDNKRVLEEKSDYWIRFANTIWRLTV